ncbi:hypothetical protein MAR_012574 [Mya arenaria]|uniref:Uncharacterized protein n=1 Tax=Mya arenaria TaxID=6604 RepID=A0ABY7FXG5_MYAAR|nr:hypothetical protein MAR_012574 [Mya arenaria]
MAFVLSHQGTNLPRGKGSCRHARRERKYPVKKLPKPYKCFDYIWTGTCRDTCYSFNILAKQKQRKQLQFKCEKRTQLRTQFTTKQKFVQKAEFKTPCLQYGGIYVDTDQLILQPLDKFRNADATIGMDFGSLAANSLIIAKRNAVFIKYWLESYKSFGKTDGNKHSQTIPFKLARKYRKYVQVVGDVFSAPNAHKLADIYSKNAPWRHQYGMHMHLKLRQRFFDEEFTMTAIKSMNTTAGAVARFIIYGNEEVCRPKTDVHSIP